MICYHHSAFPHFLSRKIIKISFHEETVTRVGSKFQFDNLDVKICKCNNFHNYHKNLRLYGAIGLKKMDSRSKQHLSARVRVRTRSKTSWEGGESETERVRRKRADSSKTKHVRSGEHTSLSLPPFRPSAFRLGICHFANFIGRRRLNGVCENHYRRPTGGGMGERREERGGTENREQIAKPRALRWRCWPMRCSRYFATANATQPRSKSVGQCWTSASCSCVRHGNKQ